MLTPEPVVDGRGAVRVEVCLRQEKNGIQRGCSLDHKFLRQLAGDHFKDIVRHFGTLSLGFNSERVDSKDVN